MIYILRFAICMLFSIALVMLMIIGVLFGVLRPSKINNSCHPVLDEIWDWTFR